MWKNNVIKNIIGKDVSSRNASLKQIEQEQKAVRLEALQTKLTSKNTYGV